MDTMEAFFLICSAVSILILLGVFMVRKFHISDEDIFRSR